MYFFSLGNGNYFTCTLLLRDSLHDHFSDSFIMTHLASFIYRNYDEIEMWFDRFFFVTEMEITLPVHCCSMMVSVTILVIVSSWHSWRVLSTEIMIKLKCDLIDFFLITEMKLLYLYIVAPWWSPWPFQW